MSDRFDAVIIRVKKWAGQCAAIAEQGDLIDSIELAQNRIGRAIQVGTLLQKDSHVFTKLTEANRGLGEIKETLEKAGKICLDIEAVGKIHDAMKFLKDENTIYSDPDGSARAFGQLFVGFGRLCRYLPPPASSWGKFLESSGDFFVNVGRGLSPGKVGGYRNQWDNIDWEYAGGRPH